MLPQVLDTWFQFRVPAANMVKGKLMGSEKAEDGGGKPHIDLEKEIPTRSLALPSKWRSRPRCRSRISSWPAAP